MHLFFCRHGLKMKRNLSSSGLSGEIVAALANLTMIESLDLSYNNLTGTVPQFLSSLDNLKLLNLTGNNFTRPLPAELLAKSKKQSLYLSIEVIGDQDKGNLMKWKGFSVFESIHVDLAIKDDAFKQRNQHVPWNRDVKPTNILLNEGFQAKLADFGMSRAFTTEDATDESTRIVGTLGYLDPESVNADAKSSTDNGLIEGSLKVFSYTDMELATRNFSSSMLLVNADAKSSTDNGLIEGSLKRLLHGRRFGTYHLRVYAPRNLKGIPIQHRKNDRASPGNVGLIFTKGDLKEVKEEVAKYKIGAPARVGLVALVDVVVPPANTGLDPSQTSFFQLIKKGDKVGSSEPLEKILEQKQRTFKQTPNPTREEKKVLSANLGLSMQQLTVWFQNRRYRKKQSSSFAMLEGTSSHNNVVSESNSSMIREQENFPIRPYIGNL
ncbi:60S acidic ribosomal protein P0-like protein, partial [Tanacetum coccineum]